MSSHPNQPHLALFARLLDRAREGAAAAEPIDYRIPTSAYTSESQFALERERLFMNRPLALAHESQIPEPGDAIVHDHLGLPLVTVRDKQGAVGTFMNVCRHRNMRLVSHRRGAHQNEKLNLRSFVCPYHQWTYGLDGKLRNIPLANSFKGLDKTRLNLVALPTEVRHGLIWLQASTHGSMDVDAHLNGIGADFEAFGIHRAYFYRQSERRIACNWKLIQDAFLDGYHVVRLHKHTVGPFFPDSIAVTEEVGTHIRSAVGRNEIFAAVKLGPQQWRLREHATFSYTVFPNSIFIMHPDYTSHIALYPQSATETIFVHSMLVPEYPSDEKGRFHYDRSFELIDGGVFEAEDIFVSVGAQAGMDSGANASLMLGAHEVGVRQFHEILRRELA